MAAARPVGQAAIQQKHSLGLQYLAQSTAQLRLSVDASERVAAWDVVMLTAASPHQAKLYEMQLKAVRRRGLIGPRTLTLVAEDPAGRRIGSGGATLNALRRLACELPDRDISTLRVLLIHAGGDSKRVPWANILGKSFIPFPVFADADHPSPTVFDHQLAISAPIANNMKQGGLLSFSGDALPLFASARVQLPQDAALVITAATSLDVAEKHGVIVAGRDGRVASLLQKAPAAELIEAGALVRGCAALLDTGIYAFSGEAFRRLVQVAAADPDPVGELQAQGAECSLYEEIAAAFVPSQHAWLRTRPIGERLCTALQGLPLYNHESQDLTFIHFGTSAEVIEHLSGVWDGRLSRRILADCGAGVDASAFVCTSLLHSEATVGKGSIIYGSRLGADAQIGNRCIVMGVDVPAAGVVLPDNNCLWQAPLGGHYSGRMATAYGGVDDNPKLLLGSGCMLGNRELGGWMAAHEVTADDLWKSGDERNLWNARLIPVCAAADGIRLAMWALGSAPEDVDCRAEFLNTPRISLVELHMAVDVDAYSAQQQAVVSDLVLRAIGHTLRAGLERDVSALGRQLTGAEAIATISRTADAPEGIAPSVRIAESRRRQIHADLLSTVGRTAESAACAERAFLAVQDEVARAVKAVDPPVVSGLPGGRMELCRLPVRFDVAGGWSDTPPYCLERPARVLNMAVSLNGELPVGALVETLDQPRWELILEDADGLCTTVTDGEDLLCRDGLKDPFALLRRALVLEGFGVGTRITQGVRVRTWARVPRGSGMGTSSILAAALLTALQRITGRPDDAGTIIDLVLLLEQRLTTGGGWQDQVGGLLPGIKFISTAPVLPLQPRIEPVPILPHVVDELQQRLVLTFTGIERLAKNVLQIVVGRYLRRDGRLMAAIAELVALAEEGRRALAMGDLDGLGMVLGKAWQIHQVLDPHCSSAEVDAIFDGIADLCVGGKLAGAGGGGFMGVMAKDARAAELIRYRLRDWGGKLRVYDWKLWTGE
jgi:fucokinase